MFYEVMWLGRFGKTLNRRDMFLVRRKLPNYIYIYIKVLPVHASETRSCRQVCTVLSLSTYSVGSSYIYIYIYMFSLRHRTGSQITTLYIYIYYLFCVPYVHTELFHICFQCTYRFVIYVFFVAFHARTVLFRA